MMNRLTRFFSGGPPPPSARLSRGDSGFSPWSGLPQAVGVLLLCVLSRLATTIHHIEDADSLRFALGVIDYDVTRLQPQFPGYTAFVGLVKLLYSLLGSYALAFSLTGGLGLFVLVHYGLSILKWRITEPRGLLFAVLVFFNPMVWLLGNRYMSDLSGAACMLAAFYHLSRTDSQRHVLIGFFLTGILAGWRLSYAPFLIAPLLLNILHTDVTMRARLARVFAGAAGILIWLIPLILVTGWDTLMATARHQSSAHFLATGGTYVTESSWPLRVRSLFSHLWTDGLGAWAPNRHVITLLVGAAAFLFLTRGILACVRSFRDRHTRPLSPAVLLLAISSVTYALWILFFQNVVHQTRHVLPLVPPLLMIVAAGLALPVTRKVSRLAASTTAAAFLIAYAFTGLALARQHMQPAAIAQAKAYVESFSDSSTVIVAAPWIEKCLSAQGVKARYLSVETPGDLAALPRLLRALDPATPLAAVGNYSDVLDSLDRRVTAHRVFHHNPYVNRLGSKVEVFRYDSPEATSR